MDVADDPDREPGPDRGRLVAAGLVRCHLYLPRPRQQIHIHIPEMIGEHAE
eukprot:CAMPEP_0197049732 /NCGR_PEP_ID=MMETSP1384-20130603/24801_1 /TAXON_ID=29189 /ORGANISM="Ammonia sp." /LENGTH=50 /DNA_ID=CAMNT_0042482057 /DNA_START=1 /DNA_END=153 /DNA_ORIENTATION=+